MTRDALNKTAVVRAAVEMADEHGPDALTMRRLGERVGVKAMALYRYVASREALLDAMVAAMMDDLHQSLLITAWQSRSGAGYLERAGQDVRNLALTHPWLVRLTALRPPPAPGLSAPLHSLACTESFLEALTQHGFDPPSRVWTYRAFCAFLLEHLLVPSSITGVHSSTTGAQPVLRRMPRPRPVDTNATAGSPRVTPGAELLAAYNDPAEFDHSLQVFLRALWQLHTAEQAAPKTPGPTPDQEGPQR